MKKALSIIAAFLYLLTTGIAVRAADGVAPYDPGTVTIPFEKVWNDDEDAAGLRPDSITVYLYRYKEGGTYDENQPFQTATVTAAAGWKYDFVLQDSADGNAIIYLEDGEYKTYKFAVGEAAVPFYTKESSTDPSVTMTVDEGFWDRHTPNNDLEMDITTVGGTKNYIAIHGTKGQYFIWTPEELSLLEQHMIEAFCEEQAGYGGETWGRTTFLTGYGYHSQVGFTVGETHIKFDEHSDWAMWAAGKYTRSTIEQNAGNITNTVSTVDVTVTKVWDDGDDADGFRPTTLSLTLNNVPEGVTAADPDIVKSGNSWTYTWTGLPDTDAAGEPITYTVSENTVPREYTVDTATVAAGETITNTHVPEKTTVTITKVWADADDQDGIRPTPDEFAGMLTLKAGEETVSATPTVTVDSSDPNKYIATWTGLPKNAGGDPIVYTVEESQITDYTASAASVQPGGTITNTHEPEKIDITVTKVWDDEDDIDKLRPADLALTLNGAPDGVTVPDPEITKDGDTWTYTWTGLPKNSGGEEVTYTVSEDAVPKGYTADSTSVENGGTITNTHVHETIEIKVTKVWDDEDDKDKKRPESITVRLLADGKEVASKTVTANDNWEVVFENQSVLIDGKEVTYTVKEDTVKEYTTTITGSADAGFTIKNTHKKETPPPTPPTPPRKPPVYVPNTGDNAHAGFWAGVMMISLAGLAGVFYMKRKYTD
ncbi:MAG: Cna B-type domain-containing protein [Erysipelotrichaceae bacterium]|nr:Cna B-type domain-containing protein [Erysipelotrichaceae bacterium]